jgi:hypothetical protein
MARRLGCLLLAMLVMPAARAVLFKYVDPVTRMASYTNFRPSQPGARELVLRPEPPPRRAASRGGSTPTTHAAPGGRKPPPMLGAANFPRIDAERQRELDADRKHIIGSELLAAQAELARLLAGRAPADRVGRRRSDVAALQRELARLQ